MLKNLYNEGMGTGESNSLVQEDMEKAPVSNSRGTTRSWGTFSSGHGQSLSTSESAGSPSNRSEPAIATPATESTFMRLNHLDIQGEDVASPGPLGGKKKKRGARAVGPDKTGRGLRQFSMRVCEKVESKGRTTYNEVADELVAEFTNLGGSLATPDQQQYDEKNIRRRVYDALNVLMAMDIISKDKKEIQWKGLPRTTLNDIEELKSERIALRSRIERKGAYLQELEEQIVGLQNLVRRNLQLYESGNAPSSGVALPFILVQTRPHATVEVEISEDMQFVHFDFNSTPFELHDDAYVLKAMRFCEGGQQQQHGNASVSQESVRVSEGAESSSMLHHGFTHHHHSMPQTSSYGRPSTSHPVPGILKGRVKHEHNSSNNNV
ncbi:hypothetical protein AMTRI_Chr08g209510 [Amborella trichopoda]